MRNLIPAVMTALLVLLAGGALANSGAVTLNPGQQSVVATFTLSAGDVVQYDYSTGLDTTFLVTRAGTEVYNTSGQAVHGTYTAPSAGTYSFAFRNDGSNLTIVSYNITAPSNLTPILIAGVAIAAVVGIAGAGLWMRGRRRAPQQPPLGPPPPPPQ
ncbi:MAG TPA: hypothetical protein VGR51_09950 [Thermoplasmata archaeon]|jgi:hypothetical protein|nr:hypothetical protein [Thermoplasmata archaeon]